MPKFVTIAYGDPADYERTPEALRSVGHQQDAYLVQRGDVVGVAGKPLQVRNTQDEGVSTELGSFMHSALPVAGFGLIEAVDEQEAISLVAKSPCAINNGVVEVWPLEQLTK